jgi:hypothetical protein
MTVQAPSSAVLAVQPDRRFSTESLFLLNTYAIELNRLAKEATDLVAKIAAAEATLIEQGAAIDAAEVAIDAAEAAIVTNTADIDAAEAAIAAQAPRLVAAGGTTGQVYAKATGADYDAEWVDPASAGAGLPVGGTTGQVLAKASGTDFDAVWGDQPVVDPLDLTDDTPGTPAANTVRVFRRAVGGRQMPAFIGPSGMDSAVQPFIARNKVGVWMPPGNATTVPGVFGLGALTATGTGTARNVATTNRFTRSPRLGFVSAATVGALAGPRLAVAQLTTGDGSGLGGFHVVIVFGFAAVTSDMRAFVGVRSATGAPTNVEPSTLTNGIGVGRGAANTTLHIYYGGSSAQTPIDLGASFPANTANTDLYELALFAPPLSAGVVNWQVTRRNTGDTASGQVSGSATVIPAATTLLTPLNAYVTNNATASAVALDLVSLYVETDY